jgi:hypothetical protein
MRSLATEFGRRCSKPILVMTQRRGFFREMAAIPESLEEEPLRELDQFPDSTLRSS